MKKLSLMLMLVSSMVLQLSAQCSNYSRPGIHVVQSGENLYRISKKYNISTIELADWNNIAPNTTLYACQELNISNPNYGRTIYDDSAPIYDTPSQSRGGVDVSSYVRQSGNKHTIRAGETIAGLAELYGYTEKRFRSINLLKGGEELSVGSSILSTDCACERVVSYEDLSNRAYQNSTTTTNYGNGTSSANTHTVYQSRGSEIDDFYNNSQGSYGGSTNPPPAQRIDSRGSSRPSSYDSNSGIISNTNNNNSGSRAPSTISAAYMSAQEIAMLDEINLVRSNPAGYIPYVEQYKRDIQSGKSFGSSLAVCDELIAELRRTPRLSILRPAPCLYNAAKNHGLDQKSRGSTGHDGSDGSWPWDRVKRACSQMTDGNENLVGGPADVREAVILLLVDDGIPSRGHRKTLLNKDWVYGATYKIGKVGFMPNCWVQKFGY